MITTSGMLNGNVMPIWYCRVSLCQYYLQYAVAHNAFCLVPPPVKVTSIQKGQDGMPLLPEIDTKASNPTEVAFVVEEYIAALWSE